MINNLIALAFVLFWMVASAMHDWYSIAAMVIALTAGATMPVVFLGIWVYAMFLNNVYAIFLIPICFLFGRVLMNDDDDSVVTE